MIKLYIRKQLKYLFTISALFFCATIVLGQCNCKQDFDALDKLLRKTPAFKDNKKEYQIVYEDYLKIASELTSNFECLLLLNKLTLGVNDNHIKVHALKNKNQEKPDIAQINLDSLQNALQNKPFEAIEGIYSLPNYVTLGIYKNDDDFHGVILNSELPNWSKGDIMYAIHSYGEDLFLVVFGQSKSKRLVAVSDRIKHGMFLKLGLKKDQNTKPVHRVPHRDSLYVRKSLNRSITYVKAGSFDSFYPTLSDAEAFYATLENTLQKPKLILDLRDNTGGGQRNSDILFDLLKIYTAKNNLYVLTNHNTGSNAEQLTIKLKNLPNTIILGDKTQGTLAYEKKKNVSNPLPCGEFLAIMTSKRHKSYIPYESKGVTPDVFLKYSSNWIEQTIYIITDSND